QRDRGPGAVAGAAARAGDGAEGAGGAWAAAVPGDPAGGGKGPKSKGPKQSGAGRRGDAWHEQAGPGGAGGRGRAGGGGGGGVVLLSWSLWWDRPRGRKRCPKCWYDMSGAAGLVCPECGKDARRERRLLKTRRRRGWAVLAMVLLLAAYPVLKVPVVRRDGW